MSKDETLARVEKDIVRGDLGKARDRLHGLLTGYPNDLELRRRLGDIYSRLHQPAMAGRYWYLEEGRTPEMDAAVAAFEREAGGDSYIILSRLKFRGEAAQLPDYARGRMAALEEARAVRENPPQVVTRALPRGTPLTRMGMGGYGFQPARVQMRVIRGQWVAIGCLLLLLFFVLSVVVGFTTVVQWIMSRL